MQRPAPRGQSQKPRSFPDPAVSIPFACCRVDPFSYQSYHSRAAQWQRDNPELAERQAEFFHSLGLDPGGAVAKEELLALELSPDYRHECGICDRDYMLRRGCPCCRD